MRGGRSGSDTALVARQNEAWVALAAKLRGYWGLIKSLQTFLLLVTGLAGYLSARPERATLTSTGLMLAALFAAISGTTALSMVADRDIDAQMERTAGRPLPAGTLSAKQATVFGGGLLALGLGVAFWLSVPFGLVVAAGALVDLAVYTLWLKRRSAWAIVFGGVAGGMPVLAGRTLATGGVDGPGLLLALSILLWIPMHVMTFAIRHADDYRRAGIPTWPSVYGPDSARRFVAAANGLLAACLPAAGWMLGICPCILALLAVSGVAVLCLSLAAMVRPSQRTNLLLFKVASLHMLGSMALITLGAML
jgi:protoheme IX farnesyltransferase